MKYPLLEDKDWGMRWARPPVAQAMPVREVYVHHTAGRDPSLFNLDAASAFRALNEGAIVEDGYSATDYSMLVHTDKSRLTTIGEARGQWMPAATKDRNAVSKAVCLFGYFHPPDMRPGYEWTRASSRQPFDEELEAIAEAIVWMVGQGWVYSDMIIRGHRDNPAHPNATACPGDYLNSKLWIVRAAVTKMLTIPQPEPDPEEDSMKVIVDYQYRKSDGTVYSGGSFTLDGIPLDAPMVKLLEAEGYKHVVSDHTYWRAAVRHRNGAEAERLYTKFEDSQDRVND